MLYMLLFPFSERIGLFNVLRYPSFRMLMAGLVSLLIGLLLGPSYIGALRRLQQGTSSVREDTPEGHQKKKGTPSMGGGLILWAMLFGTLLFADLTNRMVWAALIITMGFGTIGLAVGPAVVAALTFMVLAYLGGAVIKGLNIADYLLIPHIEGATDLAVFSAAMAGAGISFLWFNTYPATVFMGDVGSLALGGGLGALAGVTKNEIDSVIIHGVFFAEIVSVMVQVFWFKRTGRRIFRMAPIHHHFELQGWAEPKIIVRFWIVSIMLALIALASLKLR